MEFDAADYQGGTADPYFSGKDMVKRERAARSLNF
jgi:hypothetical protein